MNTVKLRGVLKNIRHSHTIDDIDYDRAELITKRKDGKEDVIIVKFKKFSNEHSNDAEVMIDGNLRSFSSQVDGKNKCEVYVFTYMDTPGVFDRESNNDVEIDGRICKLDELRTLQNGKCNIHFILANNLIFEESNQKLNSYIPCIAWGATAKKIASMSVGDKIKISGELHSREYKKALPNGELEFRIAHELCVLNAEED